MIPKSYHTSGTQRLKRAVKVLGSRTIDAAHAEDARQQEAAGVIAAVRDRNSLVPTQKALLESLGLKRRTRQLPTLAQYTASKSEPVSHAKARLGS